MFICVTLSYMPQLFGTFIKQKTISCQQKTISSKNSKIPIKVGTREILHTFLNYSTFLVPRLQKI